ncbi:MAG: hypothetical protein ABIW49_11295 [Knoellia sp.]
MTTAAVPQVRRCHAGFDNRSAPPALRSSLAAGTTITLSGDG